MASLSQAEFEYWRGTWMTCWLTKRKYRASYQGGRQKEIDCSAESEKWFIFCQNEKALLWCRAKYPVLVRFLTEVLWYLQNIKMWFIDSVWFDSPWSSQNGPVSPLVYKHPKHSIIFFHFHWFLGFGPDCLHDFMNNSS